MIVEHVARYHVSTNEVIQKMFFQDQQPNAVTKITSRLCQEEWLRSFTLVYPQRYFVPGRNTAQTLGLPVGRTYPLGPQALPTEYGVLCYAALRSVPLVRLTESELAEHLTWYQPPWLLAPHCSRPIEHGTCVELIRVDLGGAADHVARRCQADVEQRLAAQEFPKLIRTGGFRLVVITSTTDKAAAIQKALSGHLWPDGLSIHLSVIPTLIPLLPRC